MPSSDRRLLLYSHDGCGLGHLRRHLTIAAAVAHRSPGTAVLVATGVDDLGPFSVPAGVEVLKLPGLQKVSNERYVSRRLALDPVATTRLRGGLLEAAVSHFRPHVLLVDKHPVGPAGELVPALERLRAQGGRAVLGVRDVLDDPAVVAAEWAATGLDAAFDRYYDQALLYGTPGLLDPATEAGIPAAVLAKGRWCGYVVAPVDVDQRPVDLPASRRPLVVGCAGGGDDGARMLTDFSAASRGASWQAIVVTGPLASATDQRAVEDAATDAGVTVRRQVHDLRRWFHHIDAVVCMGGYNTLVEAAASACPTVCVPRRRPRREQLIRARAFAGRGLLQLVEPDDLAPSALGDAVRAALSVPRTELARRVEACVDLAGAPRAAEALEELCVGRLTVGAVVPA